MGQTSPQQHNILNFQSSKDNLSPPQRDKNTPVHSQPSTTVQPSHPYNTQLQRLRTQQQHQMNHAIDSIIHLANPIMDKDTGKLHEYRDLIKGKDKSVWEQGMSNELVKLADSVGTQMLHGTNTIKYIRYEDMPNHKKPTYARVVSKLRPQKPDPFCIRVTAGGNLIIYLDDKSNLRL